MTAAVKGLFSLSSEELKDLDRLGKERSAILKEMSALTAKHAAAVLDLGEARARYGRSCVALASGDRQADVEGSAAEVRRLEALLDGFTQIINPKSAELNNTEARIATLTTKQVSLANAAERARLEENLDRKLERIEQLKVDMRQAEEERYRAAWELGNFVSSQLSEQAVRI